LNFNPKSNYCSTQH